MLSSTSQPVSWHASRWQALRKSIRRQPVLQPRPGVGAGTGHHFTRDAFNTVSELFANQPRQDLDPVMDLLGMSQGHQANILDIIHIHKEAFTNVTKSRQCGAEGKTEVQRPMTSESQEQDFLGHCGCHHFHPIWVRDMDSQMQHFLQQEILVFQKVTQELIVLND